MPPQGPDVRRLVEVARLYYESGLTQAQIAQRLGVSRPGVQRLIQAARDAGIVTITITDPLARPEEIRRRLEAAFGLERAVVVPGVPGDLEATKRRVGEAGARCLEEVLEDDLTLGVAWGSTVREVARALHPRRRKGLRVVQMVGELGLATEASETFRAIADRLGGQAIALPAPAMEARPAIRRSIRQSAHVQEVFRILRQAPLALTGVGPVSREATIVKRGQVSEAVMRRLATQGAAGEMNTKFFDAHGRPLPPINAQIIGLELEDIRRIPRVIAVVSDGPGKAVAVLGALRGGYITRLVIDEHLASQVLVKAEGGDARRQRAGDRPTARR